MRSRQRIYLREWRILRGYTQQEVANALSVTKTHVSNIERGERQYTQELLEAAADFLDVEPAHILNIDPTRPSGAWAILQRASHVPDDKVDDLLRIIEAFASTATPPAPSPPAAAPDGGEAERIAPARRRRRGPAKPR